MASRKESATASTAVMAIPAGTLDSPVNQIQIEGLVVLKIIKHYQEEGQGSEVVQGVLLGLVVEDRLEITNCFPFPQHTEDDADFDEAYIAKDALSSDLSLSHIKPCCCSRLVSATKSATSLKDGK
ncbi:Eukaryotic translation initiation factor 3 subunit H, partial [Dissostichus eleginoides]